MERVQSCKRLYAFKESYNQADGTEGDSNHLSEPYILRSEVEAAIRRPRIGKAPDLTTSQQNYLKKARRRT